MTASPRVWQVGASRDDHIDGAPERAHVAKFREHTGSFRCIKTGCSSMVDDCALFCALHLWTFDHPVLRDASIFLHSPMLMARAKPYPP